MGGTKEKCLIVGLGTSKGLEFTDGEVTCGTDNLESSNFRGRHSCMSSSSKRFFKLTAVAVTGILMPLLWAICGSPCSLTFFSKGILWISFNGNSIGFKISDLWLLKVDGDCEVGMVGCINPSIFFDPRVKSFVSTVAA